MHWNETIGTLLAELGFVTRTGKSTANAVIKRPFAVVTGASSGIGYELARCCATNGYDLLVVADDANLDEAAAQLHKCGAHVESVEADLAIHRGVDAVFEAIDGREVDALLASAGHGPGRSFLEQDFDDVQHLIDSNITGTLDLVQRIARRMQARGSGRILVTGSIAGFTPGSYQAVYNGTKAFVDSFAFALRNELKDSGVTVTCLMPGATETDFLERADLLDTRLGTQKKADPADVAKRGFTAMIDGEGEVVPGWMTRMRAAMAMIAPSSALAERHRKAAEPETARPLAPT